MMAEVTDNPAYKQGLPEYHEVLRVPFFDKRDPRSGEKALTAMKEHVAANMKAIFLFSVLSRCWVKVVIKPLLANFSYPLLIFCKS